MLKSKRLTFNLAITDFESCFLSRTNSFGSIFTVKQKSMLFFYRIPFEVNYQCFCNEKITFYVSVRKYYPLLSAFINSVLEFINNGNKISQKRLSLFGLGYKIINKRSRALKKSYALKFKIGYSKFVKIRVPLSINKVRAFKRSIRLESNDKITLGNLAYRIYAIRSADVYKGRGLSFKSFLKPRKKKIIKKK